jgi:hypothetical protein
MDTKQAYEIYNARFDDLNYLDLEWGKLRAKLDGDFGPDELRMIADLLEALDPK